MATVNESFSSVVNHAAHVDQLNLRDLKVSTESVNEQTYTEGKIFTSQITPPTVTVTPNNVSATLAPNSTDVAGLIMTTAPVAVPVVPGSATWEVTFNRPYPVGSTVLVTIMANNKQAALDGSGSVASDPYVTATPNQFTITTSSGFGLVNTIGPAWSYKVVALKPS